MKQEDRDKIRELTERNEMLEKALRTVQNAAQTIMRAETTELEHLRQNYTFDHKLRAEHESLLERDAQMTEQVARLEAQVEAARKALCEPRESLASDNLNGALYDIERYIKNSQPTDDVCVRTLRRILHQLCVAEKILEGNKP